MRSLAIFVLVFMSTSIVIAAEKPEACGHCIMSTLPKGTVFHFTKEFSFDEKTNLAHVLGKCLGERESGFLAPCCELVRFESHKSDGKPSDYVLEETQGGLFDLNYKFAKNPAGIEFLSCTSSWPLKQFVKVLKKAGIEAEVKF